MDGLFLFQVENIIQPEKRLSQGLERSVPSGEGGRCSESGTPKSPTPLAKQAGARPKI
jgi:hypothetical protein